MGAGHGEVVFQLRESSVESLLLVLKRRDLRRNHESIPRF